MLTFNKRRGKTCFAIVNYCYPTPYVFSILSPSLGKFYEITKNFRKRYQISKPSASFKTKIQLKQVYHECVPEISKLKFFFAAFIRVILKCCQI